MKDSFARYKILGCQFHSFSTLNMSANYLVASKVSDEKCTDNLIEDSLYVMDDFSLAAFKILFLSFESFVIICLSVDLFEFIFFGVW